MEYYIKSLDGFKIFRIENVIIEIGTKYRQVISPTLRDPYTLYIANKIIDRINDRMVPLSEFGTIELNNLIFLSQIIGIALFGKPIFTDKMCAYDRGVFVVNNNESIYTEDCHGKFVLKDSQDNFLYPSSIVEKMDKEQRKMADVSSKLSVMIYLYFFGCKKKKLIRNIRSMRFHKKYRKTGGIAISHDDAFSSICEDRQMVEALYKMCLGMYYYKGLGAGLEDDYILSYDRLVIDSTKKLREITQRY